MGYFAASMSQLQGTMFYPAPVYRLYTVVPRLVRFIEQLTNWYVRFNRKRIKVFFIMT